MGAWVRGGSGWGGQGGWEQSSEACVKIQKKKIWGGDRVGGEGSSWGGGQGGCEWRSEAFVKIQKKKYFFFFGGGVGAWVRGVFGWGGSEWMGACVKIQKKNLGGGSGRGGSGRGVRVDVNGEVKLL